MTPFWKSVEELAKLRELIPEERREWSRVRDIMRADKLPTSAAKATPSGSTNTDPK